MSDIALELNKIRKSYNKGRPNQIDVLVNTEFKLLAGEIVALMAPSGAGKSTLLHIAGLLDEPDSGTVSIAGKKLNIRSDAERTFARRRRVGFVYQFHHLLPEFSSLENLVIPQLANGENWSNATQKAKKLLSKVDLSNRINHRPSDLSGGEQQRVAFCRALVNSPTVLLADEPTGNLDDETSQKVFDTLVGVVRQTGLSALVATHNPNIAKRMDRIVTLEKGITKPIRI